MVVAVLLLALLACDTPAPEPAPAALVGDCERAPGVTWDAWGQGFFLTWCTSCHSRAATDRHGAPDGVDFDTWEDVQTWRSAIRTRVLDEATMPVGGGLYDEDRALLDVMLTCSR